MQKARNKRSLLFIFSVALIAVSLTCSNPEARDVIVEGHTENCYEISREKYEALAAELGQTPETPKYPEYAVYEACEPQNVAGMSPFGTDGEVSSIRMSEGYRPENAGDDNKTDLNEGGAIPVGTYIYEVFVNDEPPPGGDDWEYELESEFTIQVADDGTVTGHKIYKIWVDAVSDTGCVTRSEEGLTTNVSGFLEGNQGSALLENRHWSFWEYHGDECGDGKDYIKDEEDTCEAIITVSGNEMQISCQGQVIYTLIKE